MFEMENKIRCPRCGESEDVWVEYTEDIDNFEEKCVLEAYSCECGNEFVVLTTFKPVGWEYEE